LDNELEEAEDEIDEQEHENEILREDVEQL